MSAVRPSPTTPGAFLCPRCGNALRDDQSWCLECGLAARTRIHPPPNWRIPIVATCLALALLAAGIAFGLVALLDDPEPTPAAATVTVPAATAPPATTPPATTPTTAVPTTPTTTPTTPAATTPGTAPSFATPGSATTPGTTTPSATTPGTTTPTTTAPAPAAKQRTFTIPGTGIELPANGD